MWIVLFLILSVWLVIPLLPALIEWRRRSDATPLPIADEYEQDMHMAAARFAISMAERLESICDDCMVAFGDNSSVSRIPPPYFMLWNEEDPLLTQTALISYDIPYFFSPTHTWNLPPELSLRRNAFSVKSLHGGPRNSFTGLYGKQDLSLDRESEVDQWLHAEGNAFFGPGCRLRGNVSAEQTIRLDEDCTFERLQAREIQFGLPYEFDSELSHRERIVYEPSDCFNEIEQRTLVRGDASIPAGHELAGNIVVIGNLHIGEGARIDGSVKAHGNIVVEEKAEITGHVFSIGNSIIGMHCLIQGVVSAEGKLDIAAGCRIGSHEIPTTVSAEQIRIALGVQIHGTIWALGNGVVIAANHPTHPRQFETSSQRKIRPAKKPRRPMPRKRPKIRVDTGNVIK